jgi:hypothetical protein
MNMNKEVEETQVVGTIIHRVTIHPNRKNGDKSG